MVSCKNILAYLDFKKNSWCKKKFTTLNHVKDFWRKVSFTSAEYGTRAHVRGIGYEPGVWERSSEFSRLFSEK